MKKVYIYIAALVGFLSIISCTQREEVDFQEIKVDKIFSAYMADDSITKTVIDGEIGDEYRKTLWLPGDSVGIAAGYGKPVEKFVNTNTSASELALLEGSISSSVESYYAIYPYHSSLKMESGFFTFDIPVNQKYQKNSFAPDAAPMVAILDIVETDQNLYFQNLCGVLIINLTGEEKVKSITFTGKNETGESMKVSGRWSVDMTYTDKPIITPTDSSSTSVTLQCEEGVQLDPVIPTPFYIVLPPATYHTFNVIVATSEDKFMIKEATKPLTIKRANVTSAAPLIYTESIGIDLSERGTSNSYIISDPGVYSFDASIIGNGISGIIPDAGFHTDDPSIVPVSADIYWSDRISFISSLSLDKESKKVTFLSNGEEGNALVAVRDAEGTILWSWHIWCTDSPVELEYVNSAGVFYVQDRNMGAMRAECGTGEQWKESVGMLYQWGRKDPFIIGSSFEKADNLAAVEYYIKNPNVFAYVGEWDYNFTNNFWDSDKKTIYDPCPVGYRVLTPNAVLELEKKGSYDKGLNVLYDSVNTTWYPATPNYDCFGQYRFTDSYGYVWISDSEYIISIENSGLTAKSNHGRSKGDAYPVRCMKDESFVDATLPTVIIKEIKKLSNTSVSLASKITSVGKSEIIERGVIIGTTPEVSLTNGVVYKSDSNAEEFKVEITGLESETKYYVKAYATNSNGTAYSSVMLFITDYGLDEFNLSEAGTANSYIVSQKGKYLFDVSTIGNGYAGIISDAGFHTTSPLIYPTSIELLWSDNEGLLGNIEYDSESCAAKFTYIEGEGNAVIAAKDINGNIIWSWHIWCTDKPQIQKYTNSAGTFYVLDRNLGATRADRGTGDQWKESMGTLYFWGRKDPFGVNIGSSAGETLTIEQTIENPQIRHNTSRWAHGNTSWMAQHIQQAWNSEQKTIYDPCPLGYIVASSQIWKGFTTTGKLVKDMSEINANGTYDNGWNFYIDESRTLSAWYPLSHAYEYIGGNYCEINQGHNSVWSSDNLYNTDRNALRLVYINEYNISVGINPTADGYALPVRCMKDEAYVSAASPIVAIKEIKEISTTTATLVGEVVSAGNGEVTDRGFILGSTPGISLENGTVYKCESGVGEYSLPLEELTSFTKYYVKAYAVNEYGTSYSQVQSFTTDYEGDAINLSIDGTANTYLVRDQGRDFIFDASVKGNSTDLVGSPASAEVLWETKNTDESVSKGDIISSVSLMEGGFVQFSIPNEYTPGNALIAVKDANGVILWSWHIWVADFDPVTTQQTYQSGAVMMDRNLGALNVQENDPKAYGLLYQWGRKDPMGGVATANSFAQTYPANIFTRDVTNSITEAIQNPTHFGNTPWSTDNTLWASVKTKYDPCPAGWRVPDGGPDGVWSGFGAYSQNVTNGAYFDAPYSTPKAFYPRGGYGYCNDTDVYFHSSTSYHWSCTINGSDVYDFQLWSGAGLPEDSRDKPSLFNVRCQKDEAQSTVSIPAVQIKEVKDVTQDGVTVVSEVVRDGRSSVIEKGILVGETSDLTIDNAQKVVKSESEENEFTLTVNDLLDGTKYYVRSYAKNSAGIGYSEARSFTTVYSGNVRDLSANGTANSYIVNKYGIYSFNATVKGNSTTPLEATPVSAAVLWETRNTAESITVGCVVKDVTFEDGRVRFSTSDDVTPGNALIAVKDADGYILWSWHIWVVDYNPEVQYHTYPSGAVMMDRDLGALSNGDDIQSNGLLYQWGRKDPFMAPVGNSMCATTAPESAIKYEKSSAAKGTLEYVETIPTTMLYNNNSRQDWLYARDHTLWGADKTMYDPCPKGWKVPDRSYGVWDNLSSVHYSTTGYSIDNTNAEFGNDYWTSISLENNERAYSKNGDRGKVSPARVRCVMESGLDLQIETIASEDKNVNVVSSVSSIAAEKIKEWGVLCSTSNTNLLITSDDVFKSADGEAGKSFGKFELSLDGLNPNSTYYLRVYVVSERGIEYSDIHTFQTKVSGDNEDFGDEDYEW